MDCVAQEQNKDGSYRVSDLNVGHGDKNRQKKTTPKHFGDEGEVKDKHT